MKYSFTLLTFFFCFVSYAQDDFSLPELKERQKALDSKIKYLQDSMGKVEKLIATFPIQELTGPTRAYAKIGSKLLEQPTPDGTVVGNFDTPTSIQVIDLVGQYYLICEGGKCGYLNKSDVQRESALVSDLTEVKEQKEKVKEPKSKEPVKKKEIPLHTTIDLEDFEEIESESKKKK